MTAANRDNLPFMCHEIKLSVQLTHSDRFGVENIGMSRHKILTRGSFYSLQRCLSILQNLITLQHVKYTMNNSRNRSCYIIHLNTTPCSFAEILLNSDQSGHSNTFWPDKLTMETTKSEATSIFENTLHPEIVASGKLGAFSYLRFLQ